MQAALLSRCRGQGGAACLGLLRSGPGITTGQAESTIAHLTKRKLSSQPPKPFKCYCADSQASHRPPLVESNRQEGKPRKRTSTKSAVQQYFAEEASPCSLSQELLQWLQHDAGYRVRKHQRKPNHPWRSVTRSSTGRQGCSCHHSRTLTLDPTWVRFSISPS